MSKTAIFYIDGDRFVFRDDEIDALLDDVRANAESIPEAWKRTKERGKQLEQ